MPQQKMTNESPSLVIGSTAGKPAPEIREARGDKDRSQPGKKMARMLQEAMASLGTEDRLARAQVAQPQGMLSSSWGRRG